MFKHYLVTGGNGFIGTALVQMLLDEGNKVTVFDNIFRHKRKKFRNIEKLKFIKGDICNISSKKILKGYRCINSFSLYQWNKKFLSNS